MLVSSLKISDLLTKKEKQSWEQLFSEQSCQYRHTNGVGDSWEIRFNPFVSQDDVCHPNAEPTTAQVATRWRLIWTNYSAAASGWVRDTIEPTEAQTRAAVRAALVNAKHRGWVEAPCSGNETRQPLAVKNLFGITWIGPAPGHPHWGEFMALGMAKNPTLIKRVLTVAAKLPEGKMTIIKGE